MCKTTLKEGVRPKIDAIFAKYDLNKDGVISRDELLRCYREESGVVDSQKIKNFIDSFDKMDKNKDSVLSREEVTNFFVNQVISEVFAHFKK